MVVLLTTASLEGQHLAKSFFNTGLLGAAGASAPSDDQFNRVSFLSHFEGSNNGVNNAFDDGSASNHTITANGDVTQGSFNPYGTNWAVDFSKDTNPRLSSPASSDFTLGTGDFTIEFFVFFYTIAGVQKAIKQDIASGGTGFTVATGNGTGKFTFGGVLSETTSDAVANKWYHIAITRNSGVFRIFRNGVQTDTDTSSVNFGSAAKLVYGGSDDLPIKGLMSNLRLVQGTSLYDSNFTTPTSPLTAVTNTKLLTLQSNRFVDNSASGHAVQPNTGKEAVSAFGPFLSNAVYDPAVNGASAYFDGSGDALRVSDTASLRIGTGQYTIECWFWFDVLTSNNSGIFAKRDSSSDYWRILATSSGVNFRINSDVVSDSTVVNKKCWNHIAITRDSNNDNRIYVNGSLINTISSSVNISNTGTVRLGEFEAGTGPMTGYICDARIVIGTAVYTGSSLTLPTAPLTAITNTKLLLNMADGQAIDSAAQNNLTLYGNANTSTDQAKFNTASLHLDGTGDYVNVLPSGRGNIYNYTVEQWLYPTRNYSGSGNFDRIWSSGTALNNSVMLHFDNTTAPKIVLRSNDSIIWTSSVSISLNAWTHVAVSCDANGTRLYIAGTERATSSTVVNLRNLPFNIGTSTTSAGFFQGYIDDFRISDFARYTSNFTAPTKTFADKGQ